MLLRLSFLKPYELISTRAKRAGQLLVITDTNKPFENSQPYFTRNGKHWDGRYERRSTIVTKCERKVFYFKEGIVVGRFCVSVAVSMCSIYHIHNINTHPCSILTSTLLTASPSFFYNVEIRDLANGSLPSCLRI